ncbi:MAG: hypothetical protein ACYS7Y_14295 [Planctomycetota bacterium]|jgi:hypothetical protein
MSILPITDSIVFQKVSPASFLTNCLAGGKRNSGRSFPTGKTADIADNSLCFAVSVARDRCRAQSSAEKVRFITSGRFDGPGIITYSLPDGGQ